MNEAIYTFNGTDISMNVFLQIRADIYIMQEQMNIDFIESM